MCTSLDVANYFLSLREEEAGDTLTNLKLQKLVYYAQGFALALFDRGLFEEDLEAWTYGPVVPTLYHSLKSFGNGAIGNIGEFDLKNYTEEEQSLLTQVYLNYGQFSAWRLRDMTHAEPPWKSASSGGIISKSSLKSYFSTLVTEDE